MNLLTLLVAHLVSSTQVERKVAVVENTKKGKKDDAKVDDDYGRARGGSTNGNYQAAPGVAEMLALLSINRPQLAKPVLESSISMLHSSPI